MDIFIGLEIHIELKTRSKLFCSCPIPPYHLSLKHPNSYICPICTGHPGTLPSPNKAALEYALLMALAVNSKVAPALNFSRKNYFYPDLPKNYQISQHHSLLGEEGSFTFRVNNQELTVRIKDVHLEEDTAKLVYPEGRLKGAKTVYIDFNRSGIPLLEIVTHPFRSTPFEGRRFLTEFQKAIRFLRISEANMEEGAMRVDANVSLPDEKGKPGKKVEIKNLNSLRFIEKALTYEAYRQSKLLSEGKTIVQETRGYLEKEGITVSQRRKEEASDYRYFPDPDLPRLTLNPSYIEEIKGKLPPLPQELKKSLVKEGLREDQAEILTQEPGIYAFFQKVREENRDLAESSSWIINELLSVVKDNSSFTDIFITPKELGGLIAKVKTGEITRNLAREALKKSLSEKIKLEDITNEIKTPFLTEEELLAIIHEVLKTEEKTVLEYLGGKEKSFNYLLGKVMKLSSGKAKPADIFRLLTSELGSGLHI
ncbi:MAG: Aspartyl/glutamyl-tRNA(Asn/Gln) amidotransferase subunit B [candidate division WS2 bacterium]|uniref:Aspartyl/glutamyl-tRNA(Asn/Gln) amidotransferase subunit B n=1 Tax=Psychracetigena formicireducens TaxID=2986056 RepID=A0A9E2BIQ6_PSYF1|nr:Aspartyl/glutamyl-tRNA(Asn/Gln) amidotransferase subunit B [Candidatus Psychracetigena formicireducens]MBT9144880.1 Aspartyl/glutamyl-tRNA(Asn/Gln) amidotransferase subunit B [Candidatus Psychracetigena formicireducens]